MTPEEEIAYLKRQWALCEAALLTVIKAAGHGAIVLLHAHDSTTERSGAVHAINGCMKVLENRPRMKQAAAVEFVACEERVRERVRQSKEA